MEDCIFCRIGKREIESMVVYEDREVIAFRDINPQAPVHILVIPKKHVAGVNDLGTEDQTLAGRLILVAQKVARQEGIARNGYRLVINSGEDAGQAVHHLHLHLLGGRKMKWPPG
ncbi:MAG: histidine triad nucleotide-binding protein [Planctomycetota bacterium]|nr:histidine triad nucleotide-binding protein [Planctomycetota bacterium]